MTKFFKILAVTLPASPPDRHSPPSPAGVRVGGCVGEHDGPQQPRPGDLRGHRGQGGPGGEALPHDADAVLQPPIGGSGQSDSPAWIAPRSSACGHPGTAATTALFLPGPHPCFCVGVGCVPSVLPVVNLDACFLVPCLRELQPFSWLDCKLYLGWTATFLLAGLQTLSWLDCHLLCLGWIASSTRFRGQLGALFLQSPSALRLLVKSPRPAPAYGTTEPTNTFCPALWHGAKRSRFGHRTTQNSKSLNAFSWFARLVSGR